MDCELENKRLRACLREIYRSFQYGPGASSAQAPFIMEMIEQALGWERQSLPTGGGAGSMPNFSTTYGSGGMVGRNMTFTGTSSVIVGSDGGSGGFSMREQQAPTIHRYISTRPQEGYVWNEMTMLYHEGDELFHERVKAMYAAEEWKGPTHEGPTSPAS